MSHEIKIKALAKYLECDPEDLEESDYIDNAFQLNPRQEKQGDPPSYYIDVVSKFKTLLTPLKKKQIKEFIENEPFNTKHERDKLYYTITRYLKRYKQDKPTYKEIKRKSLYVENVLFHLLSNEDRDYVKSYKNAFLGLPVEDNREYRSVDSGEYLILTDEEADEKAEEYILNSLWAFNSEFIIRHTDLPWDAQEMIQAYQEDRCESANEPIKALINDLDEFIEDAILSDGRGHFINSYDGEETEIQFNDLFFFVYRMG
jgi:hypothetical protein